MNTRYAVTLHKDGQMERIITALLQQIEREPNDMAAREHLGDLG